MVDVVNVAHFIEQMLTKTKDYLVTNNDVDVSQFSLEQFQEKVSSVYEIKRGRIV
ncbi:unnamed protein product [Strongylus vulgaris]|uniref:Uncharacterized protein n=1 Tax=Strongylus vulgaris TaxID=40348 RepID=A0A3P7KMT2_STRVU|nr:unnamed protein product [Strongylus vulgaris]